jgi:hypothetical protein
MQVLQEQKSALRFTLPVSTQKQQPDPEKSRPGYSGPEMHHMAVRNAS